MQLKTYLIPFTFLLLLAHAYLFGQDKIIWGETPGKILMANLDGSEVRNILQKNSPFDLVADSIGKRVYWTDNANNAIFSTGLDDKEVVKVYQASAYLQGLTIDKNQLYFVMGNTISKFDLATKKVETVVSSLVNAFDVVLIEDQVYWNESDKIKRLGLDGKNVEIVVDNLRQVRNLIYNAVDQKLYFYSNGKIYKVNPDGSQVEFVINGGNFSLDKTGRKLLLTNIMQTHIPWGGVSSINTDGSNRQFVATTTINPTSVVSLGDEIFWLDQINGYNFLDYLFSTKPSAGYEARASSPIHNPTHLAIDPLAKHIYWVENGSTIKRTTFAGDEVQRIYTIPAPQKLASIALDYKNKKFYWTDNNTRTAGIYRMNLDGTNLENLSRNVFYPNPVGLFIRPNRNQLYWSDYTVGKITHAELNGNNAVVMDLPPFIPGSLALSNTGELFFTGRYVNKVLEQSNNYIFKMPSNGGLVENIYQFLDYPLGFCIDAQNGYLYWTHSKSIMQCDLNGKNVKTVLNFSSGRPDRFIGPIQIYHPEYKIVINDALRATPLKISPNPFHAFLRIEDLEEGDLVQVYNIVGQISSSQKVEQGGSITILGQNLPVGMAYVYIRSKNGKVSVAKIYKY